MKNSIVVLVAFLLVGAYSFASLSNSAVEDTFYGFGNTWRNGGCFSDGRRMVISSGADSKVYVFNSVPTGNVSIESADVKITGFVQVYQAGIPNSCIAGNKLLICDIDTNTGGSGYHIKVWNTVPTTNTTANSCDYKITGFSSIPLDIRTDGTKLCVTSSGMYVWNSIPETNSTVSASASGYCGDAYSLRTGWFGASGRFYMTHTASATDTYYVSIYNSLPSGNFSVNDNSVRIKIYSQWGIYGHNAIEVRNILYVSVRNKPDAKDHCYVWNNIPSSNTDTSGMSADYIMPSTFSYARHTADLSNFYIWDVVQTNIKGFRNDYDTFSVTGADLATSAVDIMHRDKPFYKIRIYTYPGKALLSSMKLQLTGNCFDTAVSAVKLYDDVNNDGGYTQGTDILLASGAFSEKTVVFNGIDFYVNAGEKNLIITYDISDSAVVGHTVGANVEYFIFEKLFYRVESNMSSSLSTITPPSTPVWNNQLNVVYTQRQAGIDTAYLISLDWDDATGGVPPLTYKIYHLIDDVIVEEFSETISSKTIYNLDANRKHKFKAKVIDSFNNQTEESNVVYDDTAPVWDGVYFIKDASRTVSANQWEYKIKLSWKKGADNTSKDLFYEVWTKEDNEDWALNKYTWSEAAEITGLQGTVKIKMRCRDSAGNYADYSGEKKIRMNPFMVISEENEIDERGGTISLIDLEGDRVEVEIPDGALRTRYKVGIEKTFESEYQYKLSIYDNRGNERKIVFGKPVTIKIYYNESKLQKLGYENKYLHIMYNDGIKWKNIGGELNEKEKNVKVKVNRFSIYRLSGEKSEIKQEIIVSPTVLTPNTDEINDALLFMVNWNYSGNMAINIYDISGRLIWEYNGTDKSIAWDCREANGRIAESGAYLYVIKVEKKTLNGTVVVVK